MNASRIYEKMYFVAVLLNFQMCMQNIFKKNNNMSMYVQYTHSLKKKLIEEKTT